MKTGADLAVHPLHLVRSKRHTQFASQRIPARFISACIDLHDQVVKQSVPVHVKSVVGCMHDELNRVWWGISHYLVIGIATSLREVRYFF